MYSNVNIKNHDDITVKSNVIMSLDGEPDFDKKINRFQGICGTIRKHLKKTRTDTQMKFYKVVARPSLLYGSETW